MGVSYKFFPKDPVRPARERTASDRREHRVHRPYETVFIFDSSLAEPELEEKIERFRRILSEGGGDSVQVVHWGKRKLAYPIGKKEQGVYVILRYQSAPDALNELERVARLDEQILRHLTIVNPPASHAMGGEASGAATSREDRGEREEE
jgi:small subunit ribosomal protein S6